MSKIENIVVFIKTVLRFVLIISFGSTMIPRITRINFITGITRITIMTRITGITRIARIIRISIYRNNMECKIMNQLG